MATLCVAYLNMPEFESGREEPAVKASYLRGAYAFADYAMCFWALHVEAALTDARELDADQLKEVRECLEIFLCLHWVNQGTPEVVANKVRQRLKALETHDYYDQACQAVAIAKSWLRPNGKNPSTDGSLQLPRIMGQIRATFELMHSSQALSNEQRELVLQCYGLNHYKCARMSCQFFHQGFPSHSQRDEHTAEHDRSFTCVWYGCPHEVIGFVTSKELEKHMLSFHGIEANPDELKFPDSVPSRPLRQKHPSSHKCNLCPRKVSFLRVPILGEAAPFKRHITHQTCPVKRDQKPDFDNLRLLLGAVCLRRNRGILPLPPIQDCHREVRFSPQERQGYQRLGHSMREAIDIAVSGHKAKDAHQTVLEALLRMRIFCNNGDFLKDGRVKTLTEPEEIGSLLQQSGEAVCHYCSCDIISFTKIGDNISGIVTTCHHAVCGECLGRFQRERGDNTTCPICHLSHSTPNEALKLETGQGFTEDQSFPSKLIALCEDIHSSRGKGKRYAVVQYHDQKQITEC